MAMRAEASLPPIMDFIALFLLFPVGFLVGQKFVLNILEVLQVSVVFMTGHFEEFIGFLVQRNLEGPGTRIYERIIDGRTVGNLIGTGWNEPFDDMLCMADDISSFIEPGLSI